MLTELIDYHRKKRDWFQYDKERRKFHEAVLQFLERMEGKPDAATEVPQLRQD